MEEFTKEKFMEKFLNQSLEKCLDEFLKMALEEFIKNTQVLRIGEKLSKEITG